MNKKGAFTWAHLIIFAVFSIGTWFLYSAVQDILTSRFGVASLYTKIGIGVFIIAVIYFSYRTKIISFMPR